MPQPYNTGTPARYAPQGGHPPPLTRDGGGRYPPSGGGENPLSAFYLPPFSPQPPPVQHIQQRGPLMPTHSSYPSWSRILANEEIEVLLSTKGWIFGIVVLVLKGADAITNWGYRIKYCDPGDRRDKEDNFPAEYVRPLNRG